MSEVSPVTNCPRCGKPLPSMNALACPACGALVHAAELERLAAEAKWQEQYNPASAVAAWEQCLALLPAHSQQHQMVQNEIRRLRSMPFAKRSMPEPGGLPTTRQETLPVAILKTLGSMVISIVVYKFNFGWAGAIGFVLLILVHEMGHVVANVYYGLPASPPIFIPYLGAVINLRKNPPNARVEAVVGIAGPIAGTFGALAVFAYYEYSGNVLALELASFGFMINLFNLLPVPPLDGGRVAAAISPWIWVLGIVGLAMMLVDDLTHQRGSGILLLVLVFALPRIWATLKPSGRSGPYYAIGKVTPILVGAAYLALLGLLLSLRWYTERLLSGMS